MKYNKRKTHKRKKNIVSGGGTSNRIRQLRTKTQINGKNKDIKGSHLTGNAKIKHSKAVEKLHSLTTEQLKSISNKLYTQGVTENGKFKLYIKYNDESGNSHYLTPEAIEKLLAFSGNNYMHNPLYSPPPSPVAGGGRYNNPKKKITRKNGGNNNGKYGGGSSFKGTPSNYAELGKVNMPVNNPYVPFKPLDFTQHPDYGTRTFGFPGNSPYTIHNSKKTQRRVNATKKRLSPAGQKLKVELDEILHSTFIGKQTKLNQIVDTLKTHNYKLSPDDIKMISSYVNVNVLPELYRNSPTQLGRNNSFDSVRKAFQNMRNPPKPPFIPNRLSRTSTL